MNADILVAGGYGHSRLREALFGGVTRTLAIEPDAAAFPVALRRSQGAQVTCSAGRRPTSNNVHERGGTAM